MMVEKVLTFAHPFFRGGASKSVVITFSFLLFQGFFPRPPNTIEYYRIAIEGGGRKSTSYTKQNSTDRSIAASNPYCEKYIRCEAAKNYYYYY